MKEQLNTNTLETVFEISMDSAQHFSKGQVKFWESLCHCIYYTHMLNNADSSTNSIPKKPMELFEKL